MRFLRSLSQIERSASAGDIMAALLMRSMVVAAGRPILSITSLISASSEALLASTISQKAGVFGGGALASKDVRSRPAR